MTAQAIFRSTLAMLMAAALPQQAAAQDAGMLTLNVVSGDRSINSIRRYVPTPTVVEVRDESGQPVNGAAVTFTFPPMGPSGIFADGSRAWTGNSDAQGRITLPRFAPNRLEGSYQILVDATAVTRSGRAFVRETNAFSEDAPATRARGSSSRVWIVLGIGAAVAAGSLLAIKGGGVGDHAAVPPTTVSLGPISVGAPH